VVVFEIKRDVDRRQLAQCLEYAGWARNTSLDELAGLYKEGPKAFFDDWQVFTESPSPKLLDPSPRLVLVARSFGSHTEAALQYLQQSNIPILLIRVVFYEDTDKKRIVHVSRDHDVVSGAQTATEPPGKPPGMGDISVMDLIDAGLIQPGEILVWDRKIANQHYEVTTTDSGSLMADDTTYASPSTAADSLAGGSHNGWTAWQVKGSGDKLAKLRAKLAEQRAANEDQD
jgi:hypothetical protein